MLTVALIDNCRSNAPLTQVKGDVVGFIHVVVEGTDYPGLITKSSIATQGRPIGVWVDEP